MMLCHSVLFGQGVQKEVPLGSTSAGFGYLEYLPADYATNTKKLYPTIVFLHGIGEKGNGTTDLYLIAKHGIPHEIARGNWPILNPQGNPPAEDFIVISPQSSNGWPTPDQLHTFIDYVKNTYRADPNRVYLTGLSAGGISTWNYIAHYQDQVAAILTVSGNNKSAINAACDLTDIPIWAFHGDKDPTVSINGTYQDINAVNACTPAPNPKAKLTVYNGVGHDAWTHTYDLTWINSTKVDPSWDKFDMSIYDWFLQYSRSKVTVIAGNDKNIQLPTNSVTLSGSASSSSGTITKYQWTKQSGPAANLTNAGSPTLTASGLQEGSYIFRLTATDNQGGTAYDEVTVTVLAQQVNQAPIADAGQDKVIQLPINTVTIAGSGSDNDGTVSSYQWKLVSGPAATLKNATSATLTANNLLEGSYTFGLTVTDNDGATGYDEVKVTVQAANVLPTAMAGADQTIQLPTNSIVLKGSGSDPDGNIAKYQWTKQSGPAATLSNATTANLTAQDLTQGIYIFRLTVTDNDGATDFDEVQVTVQAANQAPKANAGKDIVLNLPTNTTNLQGSGSDADGTVASYLWEKVSGPAVTLGDVSKPVMAISGLVEGTYVFGLTVTDDAGASGYDEVAVTVQAANIAPTADAGSDITLNLPTNSTNITGSGSDADGTVVGYQWTKTTGPSLTLTNADKPTVSLSNLVEGTYKMTLTVTDDKGETGSDDVIINVVAANQAPSADAGKDKTIQLPQNNMTINGSGSDNDGTIATYGWAQVNGPAATLSGKDQATLTVTDMMEGVYVFGLTVTDDDGATDYDEVTITVTAANLPPTVDAGPDQDITLPTNSVVITSTASDADGAVTTYQWTKISGSSATLVNETTNELTVSGLVQGDYVFRITVTDDQGATADDDMKIHVQAANQAPTADAGPDQTITLPTNTLAIMGKGQDNDGSVVGYLWKEVSGPTATLVNETTSVLNTSGSHRRHLYFWINRNG